MILHRTQSRSSTHIQRRGMALAMVLAFVALGSLLAMTMLAGTSLKSEGSVNGALAVSAQYCAESGTQVAMYYLNYPDRAPSLNSDGYWAGASGMVVGSNGFETADVSVTADGSGIYTIVSTGRSGQSASRQVSRTVRSRVEIEVGDYSITNALAINTSFTVPSNLHVDGAISAGGTVTVAAGGLVSGVVKTLVGGAASGGGSSGSSATAVPNTTSQIAIMKTMAGSTPKYLYNGRMYAASLLPLTVPKKPQASAVTNPANVWYADQSITIDDLDLHGTLIIRAVSNAPLVVSNANVIKPYSGMPSLIVPGDIRIKKSPESKLKVEGLVWTGGTITSFDTNTVHNGNIEVVGAMLWGGSAPAIHSKYRAPVKITYDEGKVKDIKNFSTAGTIPESIKILSYGR